MRDPIHEESGRWYFWDETWSDRQGPYSSEHEARIALSLYACWLDNSYPFEFTERFRVLVRERGADLYCRGR